ncbi:bifunctional 3-phenylpropionate/cinnamic acid dioxygenase ferredoxin subunit [Saccharopolyspora flava]|uniref:3-phenylpropionate/trans-cinnamate dioxygenase ferredoxin subunit n=1 Tax=Saccharopolyspora flava TaxID=95161 RepID=A0A1I6NU63_9PSEU|nr:bifunctional 3-phenylpropionate/cinnamic acid dioxygenase ferredoxin subunit [Saccharopolyspora flava]SFS31425.1 3-phenylpropionate/trans-cinnamate dioxygenase ferredoxin subunit [Saccharopolyspora flava]
MFAVCRADELAPGESTRFVADVPIAVFNADGVFYAVDDTCTHQDASLSAGFVEGCFVECPLHAAFFDLRDGKPTCPPAKRALRTHQVLVEGGTVYVQLTPREAAVPLETEGAA